MFLVYFALSYTLRTPHTFSKRCENKIYLVCSRFLRHPHYIWLYIRLLKANNNFTDCKSMTIISPSSFLQDWATAALHFLNIGMFWWNNQIRILFALSDRLIPQRLYALFPAFHGLKWRKLQNSLSINNISLVLQTFSTRSSQWTNLPKGLGIKVHSPTSNQNPKKKIGTMLSFTSKSPTTSLGKLSKFKGWFTCHAYSATRNIVTFSTTSILLINTKTHASPAFIPLSLTNDFHPLLIVLGVAEPSL